MKKGMGFVVFILCLVMIITSLPILSGCKQPDETSFLSGTVQINNPIVGANISIYDSEGKLLYQELEETSNTGVFVLKITKPLPNDFRIEATGGSDVIAAEPFNDIISAEIRNYNMQNYTSLHLGPISTLLASYMSKHSEMTYEDCQAKVLEFIGLDTNNDIMKDYLSIKDSIYPAAFQDEANKAGGFNNFIDILVNNLDADGGKYHDLVSPPLGAGLVTGGLTETIGKGLFVALLKGLDGKVEGETAGWTIDQVRRFVDPDYMAGEILNEIRSMSLKLNDISLQIQQLDKALEAGIKELKAQAEYLNYETAARGLEEPISVIETSFGYFKNIIGLDTTAADFEASLDYYLDKIDTKEIETALQQIHNILAGQRGIRGIIQVWGEMELNKSADMKNWQSDKYLKTANQFEYYASIQLVGLTVLMERYNSEDTTATVKKINSEQAISNYQNRILAQGDWFLTSVESQLAWHTECCNNNHPIYQKDWSFHWSCPDYPRPHTYWPVIEMPSESDTLRKADKLLGEYAGLKNSITIRIFNTGKEKLVKELNLSGDLTKYYMGMYLSKGNKDGERETEEIKPNIIKTKYPPHGCPGYKYCSGQGTKSYTAQFARYRFDNLENGTYYINDNNKNWRIISGWFNKDPRVEMINPKLLNLAFHVSEENPYHNQLIVAWLSEYYANVWD
ncbi:hypothetical protein ACFLXX_02285 [Chloroflexota bacterium]